MHAYAIWISQRSRMFPTGTRPHLYRFQAKDVFVYRDDVVIFSNTLDDHISHVDKIITTLTEAHFTLKINKCYLFQRKVEYLGHMVISGCLEIDKTKVASLRKAQPPANNTEVGSLLRFFNVYHRFINELTGVANPLRKLLKKGAPDYFTFDEEQMKCFDSLIDNVCSQTVLYLPSPKLDCDESDDGIRCALFQTHRNGKRKPIGVLVSFTPPRKRELFHIRVGMPRFCLCVE